MVTGKRIELKGIPVSANDASTLIPLIEKMETLVCQHEIGPSFGKY